MNLKLAGLSKFFLVGWPAGIVGFSLLKSDELLQWRFAIGHGGGMRCGNGRFFNRSEFVTALLAMVYYASQEDNPLSGCR